jgi:phospholipase C
MKIATTLAAGLWLAGTMAGAAPARSGAYYEHIFVIVEENRAVPDIIGNPAAPNLTLLAKRYGYAAKFFAVSHPSQPNYLALVGGSSFGILDDSEHVIAARSLMDQLTEHGLSWKGYFQSIPDPGTKLAFSPETATEPAQLYAAKHNGFVSFASVRSDSHLAARLVGFERLKADLASGDLPAYAHIIPNQCNDMHGLGGAKVPKDCLYNNDAGLIARGDAMAGELVRLIQASPAWSKPGMMAIVITWDEDDGPHHDSDPKAQGCCGFDPADPANAGGGHIPTIVITNHGPRGVTDATPCNHYCLLRTVEDAFGLSEHLRHAGDDAQGVRAMKKLFALR